VAAAGFAPSPLIEQALTWLEANWPEADRPDNVVLSWATRPSATACTFDFEPSR